MQHAGAREKIQFVFKPWVVEHDVHLMANSAHSSQSELDTCDEPLTRSLPISGSAAMIKRQRVLGPIVIATFLALGGLVWLNPIDMGLLSSANAQPANRISSTGGGGGGNDGSGVVTIGGGGGNAQNGGGRGGDISFEGDDPSGRISAAEQRKEMIQQLRSLATRMERIEASLSRGINVRVTEMPDKGEGDKDKSEGTRGTSTQSRTPFSPRTVVKP